MKGFFALLRKEWLETVRSGKLTVLLILFLLFGIMNPAIAKLTPWMMEMLSDSLADTGLQVTEVHVDALTSWGQFFKNIPMGIIAFVLIYSGIFMTEYHSGTLILLLTKGVSRCKVVLTKAVLLMLMWSTCYWLSFAVTYVYNEYFWDNGIVQNLSASVTGWWIFGVWIISLLVFYSVVFRENASMLCCIGGTALAVYLIGLIPRVSKFMPSMLLDTSGLLSGQTELDVYMRMIMLTSLVSVLTIAAGIPVMNRRKL